MLDISIDQKFFINTDEEKDSAQKVLDEVNQKLNGKVVTKLSKEKNYCKAEEYHQKYFRKKITEMNLVSTEWLNENLNKVKIFDASWHMPNSKRNAEKEYLEQTYSKDAIFWDLENISDKDSTSCLICFHNSDYWTRMLCQNLES